MIAVTLFLMNIRGASACGLQHKIKRTVQVRVSLLQFSGVLVSDPYDPYTVPI
jgi:hypothetical protein